MVRLTTREIRVLLEAAGNIDPCMFEEGDGSEKEKDLDRAAWESGQRKLGQMLDNRETRKPRTTGDPVGGAR